MTNILMIAVDDLNAWATVLGSYAAPVETPNLDRLRAGGINFTNANAAVPLCNPARTAVLTGMSPLSSGVFDNTQDMFDYVSLDQTLPALLRQAGYETVLAGKVFHKLTQAQAGALYDRVLSLGRIGEEADLDQRTPTTGQAPAGIFNGVPERLTDSLNVALALDVLANHVPQADSAGLFLSVGLTSTHLPWAVPKHYFDRFPLAGIVLPDVPPNDLDDLPDFARQFIDPNKFGQVLTSGEWKQVVQAYLATMTYLDDMVGRLLDGLAASSIAENTMVVFWSDHGFHLGDKEMITTKLSLWEPATRAPLIIADPAAAHRAGTQEAQVVSMIDLYATILDHAGVAIPDWADGQSLLRLVREGDRSGLAGAAVTLIDGNFSLRTAQYRYTRYEDGSEELYDMLADPREFTNLAHDPAHADALAVTSGQLDAWLGRFELHQNRGAVPQLLQGGAERDIMVAGFGPDTLAGGGGGDIYLLRSGAEVVVEAADGGRDTVILESAQVPFHLPDHVEHLQLGRAGYNPPPPALHVLYGNALHNNINAFVASPVWIEAGAGNDEVLAIVQGFAAGVRATATVFGGEGNDTISGSINDDRLSGDAGDDVISAGTGGNDSLSGGEGNDVLTASDGQDTLDGGAGNDTLRAGQGGDTYTVSAGHDLIVERGSTGFDVLDVTRWGMGGFRVEEVPGRDGQAAAFLYRALASDESVNVSADAGRDPIEALRDAGITRLIQGNAFVAGRADDHVVGTTGDDSLSGEDGNDALHGAGGADTLNGGRGSDTLRGGTGDDLLIGGLGLDQFRADAGSDRITDLGLGGREGVVVSAGAAVTASLGGNWLAGAGSANAGDATILARGFSANLTAASGPHGWLVSNAGSRLGVTLTGSAQDDSLEGGAGLDALNGGGGDDVLTGGRGLDRFVIGAGADRITDLGLGGAEVLVVSAGATVSAALAANWNAGVGSANWGGASLLARDFSANLGAASGPLGWRVTNEGGGHSVALTGSARADTLTGGHGHDALAGGAGADLLAGLDGDDRLIGGLGDDTLTGGLGLDRFVVDAGADHIAELGQGGAEVVVVAAGAGLNAVLAAPWTAGPGTANSGSASVLAQGFGVDLSAAKGATGWLVSNAGIARAVTLTGSQRSDTLIGGERADALHGGAFNDSLFGHAGNDTLLGGTGNDTMQGGAGVDRFVVDSGRDVILDLGAGGFDGLVVHSGATANASVAGAWRASAGVVNAGTANLDANGFNVNLAGATGTGVWSVANTAATRVTLVGSAGGDRLAGGAGDDALHGGAGADTLIGGLGADRLAGGAGGDVFRYAAAGEAAGDVILDFDAAQGDVLDLSLIDANGAAAGHAAFVFLGAGAFTGVAGQLRFESGRLLGDVNGDGSADFALTLVGVVMLDVASIWL